MTAQTHTAPRITEGDSVSIVIASAYNGALHVAAVHAEVIAETERAVCLSAATDRGTLIEAWFPRAALKHMRSSAATGQKWTTHTTKLAPWFKPQPWTERFIQLTTKTSLLKAS